jgi:hypothetical protein
MLLPVGYSDVPRGKIAAVVTHLEITERPAIPPDPAGARTLRRVEAPELDWFRDLYRRLDGTAPRSAAGHVAMIE